MLSLAILSENAGSLLSDEVCLMKLSETNEMQYFRDLAKIDYFALMVSCPFQDSNLIGYKLNNPSLRPRATALRQDNLSFPLSAV